MAELKTKQTEVSVTEFIDSVADTEQKKKDSFDLLALMQEVTGFAPKMWGGSIIGFGQYHYKSDRSSQEVDWPLVGFSPRKAAISLYVYTDAAGQDELLQNLGKYKMGKACIYVKKLTDIDQEVLKKMIRSTVEFMHAKYP